MFTIPDYLRLRLAEEAAEVTQDVCKGLNFGPDDVNVRDPNGPSNTERLVGELNDFMAIVEMLVAVGALPAFWQDAKAKTLKKAKVVKFMAYSYGKERIEPGEEEAVEELCQRYLGQSMDEIWNEIAEGVTQLKHAPAPPVRPKAPARTPVKPYTPPRASVWKPVEAAPTTGAPAAPTQAQQMTIYLGRIVGVKWAEHWDYVRFRDRVEAELPANQDEREHLRYCARRLMEDES